MATSRRTRAAGGRPPAASSSRNPAPAASALEPIDPDAADEPAAEEVQQEEVSSGSSRRGAAGRNSRRVKAQSSAKSPVAKSARVLTPEEKRARGKAVKSFLLLVLCLVLFLGAVAGGWYFFLRENPLAREAQVLLAEGDLRLRKIDSTLNKRQPKLAREAFNEGLKLLGVPMLGNAKEPIDEHDPNLASRQQAQKAVDLAKAIRATEPRIDRIERDLKAEGNHRKVMEGFRKLNELDEAALIEHEKLTELFLKNPVEPPAGGRDEYVADYAGLIQEVNSQKIRIEQEKERRLAAITSDQEKLAHGEVRALVKEEHFKDALDKLSAFKEKFEQGKFDNLRAFVEGSAKQAWESAEKYADSRFTDYKSPGIPKAIGDQALRDARTRLDQVVERFGIEEYVGKAKALLEKYPKP